MIQTSHFILKKFPRISSNKLILKHSLSSFLPIQEDLKENELYKGSFTSLLKVLRRSSLTTATLSITTLPAMIALSGNLPSTGMSAIVGTAVVMSVGSTIFLNAMSYPYITLLEESPNSTPEDRKLIAHRLGLLGTSYKTEFRLADVEQVKVTDHPFASFRIKKDYFFVFEKLIEKDEVVRNALSRDKGKSINNNNNNNTHTPQQSNKNDVKENNINTST